MESRESYLAADGRAWKVDGRAQALVGPGLATPLYVAIFWVSKFSMAKIKYQNFIAGFDQLKWMTYHIAQKFDRLNFEERG